MISWRKVQVKRGTRKCIYIWLRQKGRIYTSSHESTVQTLKGWILINIHFPSHLTRSSHTVTHALQIISFTVKCNFHIFQVLYSQPNTWTKEYVSLTSISKSRLPTFYVEPPENTSYHVLLCEHCEKNNVHIANAALYKYQHSIVAEVEVHHIIHYSLHFKRKLQDKKRHIHWHSTSTCNSYNSTRPNY